MDRKTRSQADTGLRTGSAVSAVPDTRDSPSPPRMGYVLVGPTAAGKTEIAHSIAVQRGWPVLSADSMLVYRGMDIGTAKPTTAQRRQVRYWGLDVVDPDRCFSAADFLEEARRCAAALGPGEGLIVVGGTGLYVRVLLEGLAARAQETPGSREKWQRVMNEAGVEGLRDALRNRNPVWYDALADKSNPRRLMRALERIDAGEDEPPRTWSPGGQSPVVAGVAPPRDVLHERIEARVSEMYDRGLRDEVSALLDRYGELSETASQAIGYKEACAFVRGAIPRVTAMERTVVRTRQLAKRQMTWFRGQMAVEWVAVERGMTVERIARNVQEVWDRIGPAELVL